VARRSKHRGPLPGSAEGIERVRRGHGSSSGLDGCHRKDVLDRQSLPGGSL
jgi:hypothetical protein